MIDGYPVATWIEPIVKHARTNGWKGRVNSGYRTIEKQRQLYDRYKNSGFDNRYIAAKPGESNHNFTQYPKGAIDVSDPESFRDHIKDWHGIHKLRWAIDVGLQDSVHFSSTGR